MQFKLYFYILEITKKIIISFFCTIILTGCGSSINEDFDNSSAENNKYSGIEISLQNNKWNMDLPDTWTKQPSFPEKGIIFLARNGSQNLVISHEKDFSENITDRLIKTLKSSLSIIEEVSNNDGVLIFRGKLTVTTPMREFYQKASPIPGTNNFLLLSCSQEIKNIGTLDCPEIINSFVLKSTSK